MQLHEKCLLALAIIAALLFASCRKKSSTPVAGGQEAYFPKVKTIIQNNCLSCHSSSGTWAGRPVAFDSDSDIVQQYQSIKAAVNDPETSLNKRMPEGSTLSANDINAIIKWWEKGGKVSD